MHKIEIENRIRPEEALTANEKIIAAEVILNFDKIKPYYEKSKNYRAEIDQLFKLGYEVADEDQRGKIFEQLKEVMIDKLGCKEEWFEDAFLRQLREANVEQVKTAEEAQKEAAQKSSRIKKYKN